MQLQLEFVVVWNLHRDFIQKSLEIIVKYYKMKDLTQLENPNNPKNPKQPNTKYNLLK